MRSRAGRWAGIVTGLAPVFAASAAWADARQVAFGEYLAAECVTCHQLSGKSQGIPAIVGWNAAAFVAALDSYRRKERGNPVMQTIAGRLTDEEMEALAAYFASVRPH
jgi:cytochrome c553